MSLRFENLSIKAKVTAIENYINTYSNENLPFLYVYDLLKNNENYTFDTEGNLKHVIDSE